MKKKTTDDQNEIFDVVDKNDKVIGQARRGEVNKNKKLIHRSVYVAVFNSKGEVFLQQRSETKDTDPLKWTISVSGHVASGDNYENAAKRELEEELGIEIPFRFVAKYIVRMEKETEMTVFYKGISDGPFKLHPKEIKRGNFFNKEELLTNVKRGKLNITLSAKVALQKLHWF